eukprot:4391864-Prymnesium_polylepis.1
MQTGRSPWIGWATLGFEPRGQKGVGDDALSWGVDGVNKKLWHGGLAPVRVCRLLGRTASRSAAPQTSS